MTLAELIIKISCDSSEAEAGISKTEEKASKLGSSFGSIASGIGKAGKVVGSVIAAGTIAVGKFAIEATKAYAEYEQQVGGVQKLFGESWETVVRDAKEAYKTAGVDANTYMQNVTSFSASLIQSLGGDTQKAAAISNRAMKDMSDNANTFGTDITSIQNAYQGFSKQNYTMLDNLKLGYGGTAKEMKRLIKDAAGLKDIQKELGITIDQNSTSFDNIVNAISVMQAKMNIAGTTTREAGSTIQGSLGMMKSAWENLKIAIADPNGNINEAVGNLIDSAKSFAKNAAPVFKNAITGIGSAIKELAPAISRELPGLVNDVLPDLVSSAVELAGGITQTIIENAPMIIDGFGQVFQKVGETLQASDSPVIQGVGKLVSFVGDMIRDPGGTLARAWDSVKDFASNTWEGIKSTAVNAWTAVSDWVGDNIVHPVAEWVEEKREDIKKGIQVVKGWVKDKLKAFVKWTEEARTDILRGINVVKGWVKDKFEAFVKWTEEARIDILRGINVVKGWIREKFKAAVQWIEEQRDNIKQGIETVKGWLISKFEACVKWIEQSRSTISSAIDTVKEWIRNIPSAVVNFIAGSLQSVYSAIASIPKTVNVAVNYNSQYGSNSGLGNTNLGDIGTKAGQTLVNNLFGALFKPKAKGEWSVPYDNYPALLHRNEIVLTASQARKYREGEAGGIDLSALASTIVSAVRQGLAGATVNSYLDGRLVAGEIDRIMGDTLTAGRFA